MKLFLEDGSVFEGESFGSGAMGSGEVVFTTCMTGYLEVLTDPSYYGQIVVFTFPLIGNYGVFDEKRFLSEIDEVFESEKIWVSGVILAEHSEQFSHELGTHSFAQWLKKYDIPAMSGVDTRALTQLLREHGVLRGYIGEEAPKSYADPLDGRYVPEVSPKTMEVLTPEKPSGKKIAFVDCGAKNGIFRNFLKRGVEVHRVPFNQDPFSLGVDFDGIFFSNGPGDPAVMVETIEIAKKALEKDIPVFGICLGVQIIALAAGGKTLKMKYGHRGVNQPVRDLETGKCIITTQNHGFMVDPESLPEGFIPWMENLHDKTLEGIKHTTKPVFAVQFHPEACGGPEDAEYLFDEFIDTL